MPVTLIVGGAPIELDAPRAGLIGSADRLVAVDRGCDLCLSAGRVPEVLIGDMDSVSPAARQTAERAGARVVELPTSKDVTDLEAALALCAAERWNAPTLTAVLGGRRDHELAVWGLAARYAAMRPVIREADTTAVVLSSLGLASYAWDAAEAEFSVLALPGSARVSITNAEYELDHAMLPPLSGLGVSNRGLGATTVHVHEGTVVLVIPA